ncbi:SDR family oxidoreductase [Actinomadura sp. NAK00032]|uniref:SDR family oxidoreductase n=1 Tax=Actinomadura sp. NAK00032 TaxID=2742128 RepID=UPI001C37A553|nr:SDR family oxidoreductase [Actinomadura sp. NAK00032]
MELVAADRGRGLDVLFANAAITEFATLEQVTEEHFDAHFGINVRGLPFTVQKAPPLLDHGASIILNGSTDAEAGDEAFGVYAARKAAVRSFSRTRAGKLKGRGIRANTITPGPTDTPGMWGLAPDAEQAADLRRQMESEVPLGRLAHPAENAAAVAFLASGQSGFIPGSSLDIDGGLNQM